MTQAEGEIYCPRMSARRRGKGKADQALTDDQFTDEARVTGAIVHRMKEIASGIGVGRYSPSEVQAARWLARHGHGAPKSASKSTQKTRVLVVEVPGPCPVCRAAGRSAEVKVNEAGVLEAPPGAIVRELGEQEAMAEALRRLPGPKAS